MSNAAYSGEKLSIYIGTDDKYAGKPLYEQILELALEQGLSGGTVIRGREGFGAHGERHSMKILRLSESLPLVLEFVGRTDRIDAFFQLIEPMISEGLVTRTTVTINKYRRSN